MLPKRYAMYNEADARILKGQGVAARVDEERERRLSADHESCLIGAARNSRILAE
jgi:hypothetical protein